MAWSWSLTGTDTDSICTFSIIFSPCPIPRFGSEPRWVSGYLQAWRPYLSRTTFSQIAPRPHGTYVLRAPHTGRLGGGCYLDVIWRCSRHSQNLVFVACISIRLACARQVRGRDGFLVRIQ